jgi:glycosyltransferase involved in cell wall biosynthesis
MILKEAENFNIPSKHFDIRFAEKKEVPLLLQKTHLSLFFIKPAYSKIASSPTKMGEVLAMGLPIIANKGVGDNDYLFQNYECGILVDDFQDETFERVITEIEKLFQNNPNSYREVALDYFSLEKGIEKYNEVYQKI